jgi:CheY-like chemotaxis protein
MILAVGAASSRAGEGTRVEIYLPRTAEHTPAAKVTVRESDPSNPHFENTRVLLVDDDPDVRAATAAMLTHLGCAVDEAASGPAAIEIIESKGIRPEVMIIDFAMPGLNGIETAHRIHGLAPALPIILVSGFADAERLRAEGGLPLLAKPFGVDDLARALAHVRSPSANVISMHSARA